MAIGTGARIAALGGLLAVGVAAGVAAEQAIVSRRIRHDPESNEPLGELRGEPRQLIAVDGAELHVEIDPATGKGADDGLTVIFCHGFALNHNTWHYQRRDLRSVARLVFADQRAHGRSGAGNPSDNTIDQLGDDLGRIIDEVGGEGPIVLVGHSMGGMTIMALAEARPELFLEGRIGGIALLATSAGEMGQAGYGLPAPVSRVIHRAAPAVLAGALRSRELVEAGRERGSDLVYIMTKRYSFGSNVSPSLTNFTASMINATPVEVIADFFVGLEEHDRIAALEVMAGVEALVMVGSSDRVTPLRYSEEIIRWLPHAELVVLPSTGHMLMLERYSEVNYHLRELIASVRRNVAMAASPS